MAVVKISPSRLTRARLDAGLTFDELAGVSKVGVPTINSIENGRAKNTTLKTLHKLAGALGTPPEHLVLRDDETARVQEPRRIARPAPTRSRMLGRDHERLDALLGLIQERPEITITGINRVWYEWYGIELTYQATYMTLHRLGISKKRGYWQREDDGDRLAAV